MSAFSLDGGRGRGHGGQHSCTLHRLCGATYDLTCVRVLHESVRVLHESVKDCLCGCSGVDDLFEMIQSRTFIYQLGYGLIKIFVVNMFAELRPLFRQMELSATQNVHVPGMLCICALLLYRPAASDHGHGLDSAWGPDPSFPMLIPTFASPL